VGFLVHLATELRTWLEFVVFTVFPVAFGELAHWLYEWQVLATGILVLVAAHVWGRAILKAARVHSTNQNGVARQARPAVSATEAPRTTPAAEAGGETGASASDQAMLNSLRALRRQIRVMLATLPCTDEPLSAGNRALCGQIAHSASDEAREGPQGPNESTEALRRSLDALSTLDAQASNRSAWTALVQLNNAARDLLGSDEKSGGGTVDWDSFAVRRGRR
jgi:hypothetical protein